MHDVIHENDKLDFSPGEKFAYSNIGYLLLGEMIREVSGMPFEEYISREILQPLSLKDDMRIRFTVENHANHATGIYAAGIG